MKQVTTPNSGSYSNLDKAKASAAQWARTKVGTCYSQQTRMGNPCYDCSSLVYLSYKQAGIDNMPLTTRMYATSSKVKEISDHNNLQVGDMLWKDGHVGLYVGNQEVVNAENEKNGVKLRSLESYKKRFTKVYRVVA